MYMALALGAQIHQPTACSRLTHFSCTAFTRSHMFDCVFIFFSFFAIQPANFTRQSRR